VTTLGTGSDGNTPLSPEELADLIPSLATKEELNEWERENNLQARAWAIEDRASPADIPSDEYVRMLHKRMFDQTRRHLLRKQVGARPPALMLQRQGRQPSGNCGDWGRIREGTWQLRFASQGKSRGKMVSQDGVRRLVRKAAGKMLGRVDVKNLASKKKPCDFRRRALG
jgi:hypothetical protein